ncbi:hypothetical protein F0562_011979 [Nyssa sinensis]|uniref:Uncharacterized protein n=1 Tax=Nyssa sinensis TaxID=561372 RepID=A0A5J4ZRF4_9ASTE|nr:hypothetical protein F0562_011979 [Nyssa sinensis]
MLCSLEEFELFVGVFGGDGEGEEGAEVGGVVGGGGEVELGYSDGGDGERGALGAVEDVHGSAGDGCEENEGEKDKDGPEATQAEAAASVTVLGLGAVTLAVGIVELGFGGREGWWLGGAVGGCGRGGCGGGGGGGVRLRRGEDSVRHFWDG